MARYPVVVANAGSNYSAWLPDFDGCVATGDTVEETLRNMHDALEMHLSAMVADGDAIPAPSVVEYVEVDIP